MDTDYVGETPVKLRAYALTFERRICWTYLVAFIARNLPDSELNHFCPHSKTIYLKK
jgi:hypothetical protein